MMIASKFVTITTLVALAIPVRGELSFSSIADFPASVMTVVNQQREQACPQFGQYDGGALTGSFDTIFAADGTTLAVLAEARLSSGSPLVRSKVYRANVIISGESMTIDESTILPAPCQENLDLSFLFEGGEGEAPTWLLKHAVLAMTQPFVPPDQSQEQSPGQDPGDGGGGGRRRALLQSGSTLVYDGITLPDNFNAMDTYLGNTSCKGFLIMDQGSTQGCPVYTSTAVLSSRMCLLNNRESSIDNVVLSVRQNGDCSSPGWTTNGAVDSVTWQTNTDTMVENWCAPLNGTNEGPCTKNICTEGMRFAGLPGSYYNIFGITAMMAEILKNGPVGAKVEVMSAFMNHRAGVFNRTYNPTEGVGHKVSLIGWGSTPEGVPYWTIQNSWGTWWGESGYGRIFRGTNVMGIETAGVDTIKPISSAPKCAGSPPCHVWSRTFNNCTCSCVGTYRTGAQCQTCPADTCLSGGQMLEAKCSKCTCPYGRFGPRCEYGLEFVTRRWAVCSNAPSGSLNMNFTFLNTVGEYYSPPSGQSMVAFYLPGNTDTFSYSFSALVCSLSVTSTCPATGSISISSVPSTPATYKVYMLRAFLVGGTAGYYVPDADQNRYLGELKIIGSTDSACSGTPEGQALLDDLASFTPPITAAISASAADAAMKAARLAIAQPAIDQIKAQWASSDVVPAVSVSVPSTLWGQLSQTIKDDILPSNGSFWAGSLDLYQTCPNVVPQTIGFTKKVSLANFNGATTWNNALGPNGNAATWVNMDDFGKCTEIRFSTGVPAADTFTLIYYDVARNRNLAVSKQFKLKRVSFSPLPWVSGSTATRYNLRVTFNYNGGAAPMVNDTLKLYDKNNVLADTAYTYCRCRTAPIASSLPASSGVTYTVDLWVPRLAAGVPTRAPYTVRMHRNNTAAVVALVIPNVNWALGNA